MSQDSFGNPAGEGGFGGFDLGAMLQQAQQMQAQLMAAQEQLAHETVEGAAGSSVRVRVTGTGDLDAVEISTGAFDGDDAESLTDLGDLVVAAFRDAKARADALAQEKLGPLAGALGGDLGDLGGLGGALGGGDPGAGPGDTPRQIGFGRPDTGPAPGAGPAGV